MTKYRLPINILLISRGRCEQHMPGNDNRCEISIEVHVDGLR